MLIRPATPEDLATMVELETHTATAAHWGGRHYAELFAPAQAQRVAWVVEEAGQAQGFLIARTADCEWEIENIVVDHRARRQGLGTRLLAQLIDQARQQGADSICLEVRESNWAARSLYKKRGFVERGRRRAYYRDPEEDALVYQLRLR